MERRRLLYAILRVDVAVFVFKYVLQYLEIPVGRAIVHVLVPNVFTGSVYLTYVRVMKGCRLSLNVSFSLN